MGGRFHISSDDHEISVGVATQGPWGSEGVGTQVYVWGEGRGVGTVSSRSRGAEGAMAPLTL